ncbi:putative inactive patatin-like protein 9 [Glycine max]|nr:putative inactive patatin-like protein 9 [Glycine max]
MIVYLIISHRSLPLKLLLPRPHLAPSVTPSLFTPFHFSSANGKTLCAAVNSGLVMNNLVAAAVTHVLHNKRNFRLVNGVEDLLDEEIFHAVHQSKIALVVKDVCDDSCYRIVHHQATIDSDAQGFSIDKGEVEGSEEARVADEVRS